MRKDASNISCEQVLEDFAMEPNLDKQTLLQYLQKYPQYTEELILLSNEVFVMSNIEERELTSQDEALIDSAWSQIQSAGSPVAADPLADLPSQKAREIAQALNVPRQVILAFHERTVEVASVPQKFLNNLASLLDITAQNLQQLLTLPPKQIRSFKADNKPAEASKVTFERLLRDADLSDKEIESLMEDGQ